MRKSLPLVILGLFVGVALAQERFDFYPGGTYDPAIPTLKSVLGYQVGERVTDHHRIGQYLQALAAKSERIRIGTYAVSHEGRDLWYALVSSPENMKRLDEIRTAIGRLTDPRKTTEAEAARIIASTPAVVWLAYGVHGNEHSSAEASLMTAYQLTAGTDADTQRILQETVTILIPEQNPDGRARFLHFHDVMKGRVANPDPNAAEHNEGWPAGRGNHYLFDMNRDWFFLTQPEIRGQVRLYRDWNPVVFADLHEMGANSTYYFAPPALPVNKNLPEQAMRWWKIYGRDIATRFDKLGFDYFTAENYEEFYPGYGSSWPLYKGATGMTYEQASAEGLAFRRRDKTIITLRDAAWHHFTASMSTCLTTAERRQDRLKDFYEFFQTAVKEGGEGPIREFLVAPTDPAKIRKLTDNLLLQGIEARVARAPFTVRSARDYYSDKAVSRQLPAGTVIVPLDQPSKRLIQAIFEREAALDETFLKEEKRRRDKRDDTQIYDITAWSLPYLYDLEAYWTSEPTRVESEPLQNAAAPSEVVAAGRATYAYLMPLETNAEFRALAALLRDDTHVSVARKEIVSGGRRFKRGTIVLRVHTNKEDLHDRVEKLARQQGARFFATGTGWSDEGISLGSSNVVYVEKPRVAVVLDAPVSTLSYGWMAHLFDYQYEYPYTAIRASQLNRVLLKDYNVLIFPDSGGGLQQILGKEGLERIRSWVRDGGTLIAIKGAAALAAHKDVAWTTARVENRAIVPSAGAPETPAPAAPAKESAPEGAAKEPQAEPKKEAAADKPAAAEKAPAESEDERPWSTSGAFLRTKLDDIHFLTYGYDDDLPVLVSGSLILTPSKKGRNVVTFFDQSQVRLSGFMWDESRKQIAGKAYLVDEPTGAGHIILFADDPNFRGAADGQNKLFLNAVFFGPSLRE